MDEIEIEDGIAKALDALLSDRLAVVCGAGLSMAPPSSVPSANEIAYSAKRKYDATYGADRDPLPASIEEQAEFFFERGELATVYLRTYVDRNAFAAQPNKGHHAIADLLLTGAINISASTNVDQLIESAGSRLFGQIGAGVDRAAVAQLPPEVSPLLKIHGCWSDPTQTVWAKGQVEVDPIKTQLEECAEWLSNRLLNHDLLIVGYWTDWDYLNEALEKSLGQITPSRVVVIDPCETETFSEKAPALFDLGQRAHEFCHVRSSGDEFLDRLRVAFSRSLIRRTLYAGRDLYRDLTGEEVAQDWLEPTSLDSEELWHTRRDLEGCSPNEPAKSKTPMEEPLIGMTLLQLQARGAVSDGRYWSLDGQKIRVLRASNRPMHHVEAAFARETPPVVAPDVVIAVGAVQFKLRPNVARNDATGSIARGPGTKWISWDQAQEDLGLE